MRLEELRDFLLAGRPFRRLTYDALLALIFVSTDRLRDSVDIEAVCLADVLADSVQLVDDGIASFHRKPPTGSSSGVQMIGGSRPSERQIVSIVPRMVAFAMCLQFHVNRYSIW